MLDMESNKDLVEMEEFLRVRQGQALDDRPVGVYLEAGGEGGR